VRLGQMSEGAPDMNIGLIQSTSLPIAYSSRRYVRFGSSRRTDITAESIVQHNKESLLSVQENR
jgi:hypothetical protein